MSQPKASRSLFEPGVLVLSVFLACYLLPALTILVVGGPDGEALGVEAVSVYGIVFVLFFAFSYRSSVRYLPIIGRGGGGPDIIFNPSNAYWWVLLIFISMKAVLKYYGVGDSDDYSDQYLVRRAMPQAVSQFVGLLNALMWILIFVVLIGYFSRGKTYVFYRNPIVLIGLMLLVDVIATSSRSVLITYMFALLGARSLYRRPIGLWREIMFVVPFVLAMGGFAFFRAGETSGVRVVDLLVPSEFVVMYRNALHLVVMTAGPDYVPPPGISYIQAFLSFLPKQIYPDKWSLSEWYIAEYFPGAAEAGGGLAFGIVPEAIVNWGLLSMVFQASFLGCLFRTVRESAKIATSYADRSVVLIFYLFCISLSYQVVRGHSFAVVNGFFLGFFIPFLILREVAFYARRKLN